LMPRGSIERKMVELTINGQSHPTEIVDGRIGLPQRVRDKIGLELGEEAFFIASGDTFQIWKPETFDAQTAKADEWIARQGDDFDPLSLLDQKIGD
jgi:MraZ protein